MKTLEKLAAEVQEMVQNGASISDLTKVLGPYHEALEKEVERRWRESPDRMGGQFASCEYR